MTSVPDWMMRRIHHFIDFALGVDSQYVLNPDPRTGARIEQVLPDLRRFLAAGRVDYTQLRVATEFRRFCDAVGALHHTPPPASLDAARAWWINLYNGLIIHAVIQFGIRRSVWEDHGFFRRAAYIVDGYRVSADDIEHGILRGNRRHPLLPVPQFGLGDPRLRWSLPLDPRIHFTLVCAAHSCPAINFYTPEQLNRQLDLAASAFINGGGAEVDINTGSIALSQLFRWYRADFGGRHGVLEFISRYLQDEKGREVVRRSGAKIRHLRYDWTLNHMQP